MCLHYLEVIRRVNVFLFSFFYPRWYMLCEGVH